MPSQFLTNESLGSIITIRQTTQHITVWKK